MRHIHRMRVPFGDVDHAGIVYYPRLFHYFHLAYESFFHDALAVPFQDLFQMHGLAAPVVSASAEFKAPLRHGEQVEVVAWICRLGRRSWTWRFQVMGTHGQDIRATGRVTHAFTSWETLEVCEIPPELRERVASFVEAGD